MDTESIILIISAFITSSISAVIGMGGGIILLGIMALTNHEGYMVIALHGIIQLFSNTTRTYIFREHLKKKLITDFSKGVFLGLSLSAICIIILIRLFNVESASDIKIEILKPLIGIFIIWFLFLKKPKKTIQRNLSFIPVGAISGLTTVFIGATGPLIAPFFLDGKLSKNNIIANKAACQMITHAGKIPLFIFFFDMNYIGQYEILLPLILAVFLGTNLGKSLLKFIPENIFRILFKTALTIIAIRLILINIDLNFILQIF